MSVSTISSLDEEEEAASKNSPDIRSLDGEIRETLDVKKILGSVASLGNLTLTLSTHYVVGSLYSLMYRISFFFFNL